jgi:hypothetical protein
VCCVGGLVSPSMVLDVRLPLSYLLAPPSVERLAYRAFSNRD